MKMTGQILKENRENKGISISEVAIATKINNKTLLAIEAGQMDQLPPKTFLRGFVRAYASYLELDVNAVMNTYFEEMGSTRPKADLADPSETAIDRGALSVAGARAKSAPNEANDAINPKASLAVKVGAVAAILLLVILIVVFKNKMENYEKEAIDKSVPGGLTAIATPVTTPAPSPSPHAESSANISSSVAHESPTPVAQPSPTATPAPTPKVTPTPNATSAPVVAPVSTPAANSEATATPVSTPTPSVSPTPAKQGRAQEVIVEALDNVDIDVTVDDEGTKKIKLRAEQVQNIKAKRKVVLRFTDGGAVNLIVNGVERGVPGDLGKPSRVELP